MIRLLPLLTALSLAGCAAQMPKDIALPLIDAPGSKQTMHAQLTPGKFEASLMSIGGDRDLAQQRGSSSMGFVNNATLESYMNDIHSRLLASSGITDVPGKVLIEANPALGGKASADGNIMIPMAWIPDAKTDDELAAIVAHELAHVLLKHQSTDIVGLTQKRLQSAHEMLLGGRMQASQRTQLGKAETNAVLAAQLSVELIDRLAMPAWNRRQETEADLLGLDLMIRAGYSAEGMSTMLETLRAWEDSTRTPSESLHKQLAKINTNNPDQTVKTIWNNLTVDLARAHPETDKRIDAVVEYQDKHYADMPHREMQNQSLAKLKANRGVSPLINNFRHTIRAKRFLGESKTAEAYKEALQGVLPPTAKEPMPHWILWQTAVAVGKQKQHQKSLEYALNSPEPIREVYEIAIKVNEQSGKFDAALNLVNKASEAFGDAPDWAPDRIRLLRKTGRKDEANALSLKCTMQTPQLRHKCQEAAKS